MDELDDSSDESIELDSDEPSISTVRAAGKRANDMQAKCHVCGRTFASYKQLMAHHQANHLVMTLQCDECGRKFSSSKLLAHHRLMCSIREEPPAKKPKRDSQVGRGHRAALQNNAAVETFIPTAVQDILGALRELEPTIIHVPEGKAGRKQHQVVREYALCVQKTKEGRCHRCTHR